MTSYLLKSLLHEPENHKFLNIKKIEEVTNNNLISLKKILKENQEMFKHSNIFLRESTLLLEVFILADHQLDKDENEFWYNFTEKISNIFEDRVRICVTGDKKLWDRTKIRNNWIKFS